LAAVHDERNAHPARVGREELCQFPALCKGQYLPAAKKFYAKKAAQRNQIVAVKALAHKIARACYYIMRDRVPFEPARLFG